MASNKTRYTRTRSKRLNLRASERQVRLIQTVAHHQNVNVTEFILESACRQAEQVLTDERQFFLSPSQWKVFIEALERPARVIPRLKRLLSERSILEPPE